MWKLQFLHLLFESKCIKISSPTFKFETKISRIASPSKIALSAPVVETVWIYYWSPLTQAPQTFSTKEKPSLDIVFEIFASLREGARTNNKQMLHGKMPFESFLFWTLLKVSSVTWKYTLYFCTLDHNLKPYLCVFVAFSLAGSGRLELEEDSSSLAMHLNVEFLAPIPKYHPQVSQCLYFICSTRRHNW